MIQGVNIGNGTSVGTLSLVTKSLDEWGVYLGSPAKRIKVRKKDLLAQEKLLLEELKLPIPEL